MNNILLIEDDESIVKGLVYNLEQVGFNVDICINKGQIDNLDINNYNLIILDIMIPGTNGYILFNEIRSKCDIPIIFLTAIDDEDTIVKCFNLGCDDYVVKPFKIRELISRINRLIGTNKYIRVSSITIDTSCNKVYVDNKLIDLTSLEYKILLILLSNKNKIVTREYLLSKIYDYTNNYVNDNTLTVYIKRIRNKLNTDIIKTIKGIGYRIDND